MLITVNPCSHEDGDPDPFGMTRILEPQQAIEKFGLNQIVSSLGGMLLSLHK